MGAFDPNYEEYKAFGGTLEGATFSALLPKASAIVRDLEFPNEPSDSSAEAHKRAVCGICLWREPGIRWRRLLDRLFQR